MTDLSRSFLIGMLSSVAAALLLALTGLAAARTHWPARGIASRNIKLCELPDPPGSIRRAIRTRYVLLALCISLMMIPVTATAVLPLLLSSDRTRQSPHPDFLRSRADALLRQARQEADSIIRRSDAEAESIIRAAELEADEFRDSRGSGTCADAQRHIARATERVQRLTAWNQELANRILKDAEQQAADLRKQADQMEGTWEPVPPRQISIWERIWLDFVSGLLIMAYLATVCQKLGMPPPRLTGFLGALIILAVSSLSSGFGGFDVLEPFDSLLMAAALYSGAAHTLTLGEVLINSLFCFYQRLHYGVAIVLVTSIVLSMTLVILGSSVAAAWYLIMGDAGFVQIFLVENVPVVIGSGLIFGDSVRVFFGALSGLAFCSVLLGRHGAAAAVPEGKEAREKSEAPGTV